jgi:diketogulonate reductase-like aldo/keto reductase
VIDRRTFLAGLGGACIARPTAGACAAAVDTRLTRPIPASGERLPVIGLGTWLTFNVTGRTALESRRAVLQAFFEHGGRLVDSSPMYGAAEAALGYGLQRVAGRERLFAASKVWTWGRAAGIDQMERSRALWGIARFDLLQVHNLLDLETHLATLRAWRAAGRVRYIGVTTSHGRRHADLERLMTDVPLDFVQLTLNVVDRAAERRLLPLAAERGIAVIANRPFRGGALFARVTGRALPGWANEFGAANWAQFFLKFIVAHPAVTCAIPATTRVGHLRENMGAGHGPLPDAATRERMAALVAGF